MMTVMTLNDARDLSIISPTP